jgi:four helix bundle protein
MRGHRDLIAWKKAIELVLEIYRVTNLFPKHELYGLVSQLRRAAVSVPSNIAEGYGRNSPNELHQFIGISRGSLAEVETQIEIAVRLGYLPAADGSALLERILELGRILAGLREWSAKAGG